MIPKKVMVVYGGVSPEHDVAVVTAWQVMHALKKAGFEVMPVYISKNGSWYLGDDKFLDSKSYQNNKKLLSGAKEIILSPEAERGVLQKGLWNFGMTEKQPDVIFPVVHGRGGEDGTLQGLFEMSGIPYVGCGVTASAVKIDKYLAKIIAKSIGIDVLADRLVIKGEKMTATERKEIKYPVMVKPIGLGSSIGLSRVEKEKGLDDALEVAFCYDRRVIIEEALSDFVEVNISIMGNGPYEVSMTEHPVASSQVLSFSDKYEGQVKQKGMAGAKRLIPADVKPELIRKIEKFTKAYFRAIGGKGIARVDYMVSKSGKIYFNEINTMPGSLAFYLWAASGFSFEELVTRLVNLALV
ncbi:MAG: D-alanine-D-alanine ligase [Candidatus Collierbacteria bacterium GW2011_GWC2_44_18]|uniref:D-alanine--D-alanine ligase n=1 Tax=Candidatus Collierbacteria bacterium GW2011_GWC2_44_18 TaxID=1618392 RepID=A0A0G1HPH7_9BACT|nr:MAG: D-alanine-D-alanine ligase [Candidatus Collierbacteria bacterium GW2011_GWC2_44_18]